MAGSNKVARIVITGSETPVAVGVLRRLTATALASNGRPIVGAAITWGVVDRTARYAVVSADTTTGQATLTPLAPGQALLTATSRGVTGRATLTVQSTAPVPPRPPIGGVVATVPVSLASTLLTPPATTQATATPKDAAGVAITGKTITWASSTPSVATVSSTGLVTSVASGSATITATVDGVQGTASLVVQSIIGPGAGDTTPILPTLLDTGMPQQAGVTRALAPGDDLQAALDAAQPGDTITLPNGATYAGNYTLPVKAGSTPGGGGWIVVRPNAMTGLVAEGTRYDPRGTFVPPKILSPNTMPALATQPGAAGFRFIGTEVGVTAGVDQNYGLVTIGEGNETLMSQYPGRFTFDRCYVHGEPSLHLKRAFALNGIATAVIDSHVSEIHDIGYFSEVQGLLGWCGPGPFKIVNNYVEAAGVSIMFGGASDPNIPGVLPSDLEIRRNHVFKPLPWIAAGYSNKNCLELKDAQRVLIEANVFENNWVQSQTGFAIQMTGVSQTNTADWITIRDITFRLNHIKNSPQGMALSSRYQQPGGLLVSEPMRRVLISQVWFEQITFNTLLQLGGDHDAVTIERVTGAANNSFLSLFAGATGTGKATRFTLRDNQFGHGLYGLFGDNAGVGSAGLAAYVNDYVASGNAVWGNTAYAGQYPAGFDFYATEGDVPAGRGADLAAIIDATAGVVVP